VFAGGRDQRERIFLRGRIALESIETLRFAIERLGNSEILTLLWKETGGPVVVPPEKTGFGSRLISQTFGNAEDTRARIEYHPEGLEFRVGIALSEKVIK